MCVLCVCTCCVLCAVCVCVRVCVRACCTPVHSVRNTQLLLYSTLLVYDEKRRKEFENHEGSEVKCTPASTLYASRHTQELSSTLCNTMVHDNGQPTHTMTKVIAFF